MTILGVMMLHTTDFSKQAIKSVTKAHMGIEPMFEPYMGIGRNL